jgi:hypothetical protein
VGIIAAAPANGEQASSFGAQAQQTIRIGVSVRPVARIREATATGHSRFNSATASNGVCVWSNFDTQQLTIRAEWSDGRTTDVKAPSLTTNNCNPLDRKLLKEVDEPAHFNGTANVQIVTLVVAPD